MTMRVSKNRIDMDDKVLQKPVLKDYGETVTNSSTLLYGVDASDVYTNVADTVNGDSTANWVFGDVTSLMRFSGLTSSSGISLNVKARVRKNAGSGAFNIDYGDGALVDISGQFVDSAWTVVEAALTSGASGGWLDFPTNGNYNGYDIDVDYILIHETMGGSEQALDLTKGNVFDVTLSANTSFTFFNPPASGTSGTFTLLLSQDSTGGYAATWPAAVVWTSDSEPTLYDSGEHLITFSTLDGGTTWYGWYVGGVQTVEYNFDSTVEGFAGQNTSVSASGGSLLVTTPTTADPMVRTPSGLTIAGGTYTKIRISIKRTAGAAWDGTIYYTTGGHSESASYRYVTSEPSWDGNFQLIVADMSNLTAGGTDWIDNTITQVRFDFGASTSDEFEVEYIKLTTS